MKLLTQTLQQQLLGRASRPSWEGKRAQLAAAHTYIGGTSQCKYLRFMIEDSVRFGSILFGRVPAAHVGEFAPKELFLFRKQNAIELLISKVPNWKPRRLTDWLNHFHTTSSGKSLKKKWKKIYDLALFVHSNSTHHQAKARLLSCHHEPNRRKEEELVRNWQVKSSQVGPWYWFSCQMDGGAIRTDAKNKIHCSLFSMRRFVISFESAKKKELRTSWESDRDGWYCIELLIGGLARRAILAEPSGRI